VAQCIIESIEEQEKQAEEPKVKAVG